MRDFPSCFGENGVQIADSSSSNATRATQNLVTCVYHCQLQSVSRFITITWTKYLMGQGFSVGIENSTKQCLCKVDIKPWLFSKRKGFKNLEVGSNLIDIYWDLSSAKFGYGPEPLEGFYLAVVFNQELILHLGDLQKQLYKKINVSPLSSNAVFVAKREHIYGKRLYNSKGQFCDKGKVHNIGIELDTVGGSKDPCLVISIDSKEMIRVTHLKWKFRGNTTIVVEGFPVEVYWDVYGWLFGNVMGNAVFLFRTRLSTENEKFWAYQSPLPSPSVLNWDGSHKFSDPQLQDKGFSLILCAWKNE
ncbi:uncharacterized protein LOC111402020 [Olea europaea var. sylvestris]|uniref:Uncharacterized protein n=1 Tax=Olea europaea subsp. europaea TaxID=158383 RepID=A0A8S0S5W9_OLEEU|nr:uncharacterized protein LOC111402020 [Olea europaea var. sylvestris]XP_022885821.1 uncharacterized protein LOC111402020 [Olea europaea var. sylvestris]CAA2987100.1 Hypothetical predicted protein [Olea europaea subsp. europaea]